MANGKNWIDLIMQKQPQANKDILEFIYNFFSSHSSGIEDNEHVRKIFRDGYCYYFALMLQDAFPGGKIVWCAPFGHIAYQYNNIVYDIEGVNESEVEDYIPISYLGERIYEFKHIPNQKYTFQETTEKDIENIINTYKKERITNV